MKNLVLLGLFVLFLVAVQFASGKTVDEIIEKHIQGIGGFDNAYRIKSIYMEGVIKTSAASGFLKIFKEQNKFTGDYSDFKMRWQIIDDEDDFSASANSAAHIQLFNDVIANMQTDPQVIISLVNYVELNYQPVMAGKEVINENTCYKIKLTTKAGGDINYWFTSSGFQLTQVLIEKNENDPYTKKTSSTLYTNYKAVDGVQMAHNIEIVIACLNENDPIKIAFNTIEIDQPFKT